MQTFMLKINKLGSIEQIVWSDPNDLVPGACHTAFQLFTLPGKAALVKAMKRCAQIQDALFCGPMLKLNTRKASMSVAVVPLGKSFLVFAYEPEQAGDGGFQEVFLFFMNLIRSCYGKSDISDSGAPDSEQVEMIQALMAELRERKQLLEEANTRLNRLNEDLNNRLVKDSLTGLVSRYQYRAEMEFLIGQDPGKLGIFVFIDIDDFKSINDKHGHGVGDKYLVEFADRLRRLPIKDIVCMRISGDEFGLFIYGLEECKAQTIEGVWKQMKHHVMSGPITVNGRGLPLAISAGMAVYGVDTTEIFDLIECADQAMYAAKRRGKNRYSVYSAV